MSTYTYLVNPSKKTFFELGKDSYWSDDLDIFKVDSLNLLLSDDPFEEECDINWFIIEDSEMLKLTLMKHFKSYNYESSLADDFEYINSTVDKIIDFCRGNTIAIINDCFNTYHELKGMGFIIIDSRYV